jgi:CheY-like chemotaxis protein
MPEGGTLSIEIGTTEGASAGRTSPTPDHVAITLSDTGAGMDAATLEHCIEPFFTTKQPGRGTGLGLAAVLGIVDQSGGDLWIDSQIGVGTNITIVLPRVTDAAEERHVISLPTPRDPVESRIGTVLVVDDDQAIRGLVTSLLRDRGYKVLAAHSGPAAVQMAASYDGAIDLLLTDVAMPAMSGVELAQTLHPILEVPVLFMSGFAEEFGLGEINGRLEANFIAKPFTPDDLVVQVQRAIDGVNVRQPSKR